MITRRRKIPSQISSCHVSLTMIYEVTKHRRKEGGRLQETNACLKLFWQSWPLLSLQLIIKLKRKVPFQATGYDTALRGKTKGQLEK